jgi:hypothetical protein
MNGYLGIVCACIAVELSEGTHLNTLYLHRNLRMFISAQNLQSCCGPVLSKAGHHSRFVPTAGTSLTIS